MSHLDEMERDGDSLYYPSKPAFLAPRDGPMHAIAGKIEGKREVEKLRSEIADLENRIRRDNCV